jgi:hypothetical protein
MKIIPEKIAVGWVDPEFVSGYFAQNMAAQLRDMEYHECAGNILRFSSAHIIDSRNKICQLFLDHTDNEWLWMMDADQIFDRGHVMKLWETASEHDVKLVSGVGWLNRERIVPSIFYWTEDGGLANIHNWLPEEPIEVAATGFASMLIHRELLETVQPLRTPHRRWFDFYLPEEVGVKTDKPIGEDIAFCLRAAEAGFPMMVNPDARTEHLEDKFLNYQTWREQWTEEQE